MYVEIYRVIHKINVGVLRTSILYIIVAHMFRLIYMK
jgi:hypothetical protein